jgi:ferrous iron transport protein A
LLTDLAQLKQGESGTIVDIQGGQGLIKRLESLGIRPGVKITKLTAQFMRGPVTMRIGNSRIAVGFGMAKKIVLQKDGL